MTDQHVQACIVIQGFADAIIYGVNESSISVWRNKFRKQPPTAPAKGLIEVNVVHEITVEHEDQRRRSDGDSYS
jgi:hypothetical protein